MAWLESFVAQISEWPTFFKLIILSLSVMIEYIFPIFPGDTVVLLAGFLNARGAFDLKEIFLCIIIGSLLGSFLAYYAGRLIALNPKGYRWVDRLQSSDAFHSFSAWYSRYGALFLLLNRFFHGIRALFFVFAGMINLPAAKVLSLGGFSAIIYSLVLVLIGHWLGFKAELIIAFLYQYSLLFYFLLALLLALLGIYFWHKKFKR